MMHPLMSDAAPAPPGWHSWAIAAAFALAMLLQATWNNAFPAAFHPDESSKVGQILRGDYDFHHPLLMLRSARLLLHWRDAGDDPARIVVVGRTVSALASAGAVLCLVLVAAALGGRLAAAAAGLFLVTNHSLFELAHYFKEDTTLLFGISLFLLGLVHYQRAPHVGRAILLGTALGIALSAKYTALILVPLALFAALIMGRERRVLQVAAGAATAGLMVLIINWPALSQLPTFADSFVREFQLASGGYEGIGRPVPHGYYLWLAWTSTNPVIWVLVGVYLAGLWLRRRRLQPAEVMIAAFPFAFALLLSFFSEVSFRYYLPGTALLLVLAGLGAADLARLRRPGRSRSGPRAAWPLTAVATLLAVAVQAPTLAAYHRGFALDTRSGLAAYLRANVPAGTPIAQDNGVKLQAFDLAYPLHASRFVADLGSIDALRERGIHHVAVTARRYDRLFRSNVVVDAGASDEAARRRHFYERLFAEGDLLFEAEQGPVKYLQPHIALYRLPRPAAEAAGQDGSRASGAGAQ
jgi:hypothetical protein